MLGEVADIVEQIFRIACTQNLHPRPEEYDAAACDYQADHGLTYSGMCVAMRQYGTLTEIHERPQFALMRFYARCWRPLVPEDGMRGHRKFVRALKASGVLSWLLASDVA